MESNSNAPVEAPPIAAYSCYRTYLRDLCEYKKSVRSGFSFRQVAAAVGLGSPNYLQLVIRGRKNLSAATAERVAEALRVPPKETRYFVAMVQKENALNDEERDKAERHVCAARKALITKPLLHEHQEVLGQWYHLLVRELVFLNDFRPDGQFISEKLNGIISAAEAEDSLALLLRTGYVVEANGRYVAEDPVIDTGLVIFTHAFMQQMHAQMLHAWASNITKLGAKNQELGVLNIPLARKDVAELQKRVRGFQDEIIGWAEGLAKESAPDQVVQLGTYLMDYSGESPKK